jgi:oxygen-independent coproporphyrinogen-3 oxidase
VLYIHIPFCDSKCYYCAFNSYTSKNYLKKDYFEALQTQFLNEIKPKKFHSIFIGGGTPSVMNLDFYEKLFKMLNPYFDKNTEISIEANPNSVSFDWLKGIKQFGVNRISFGIQSFDDTKLKFLGRNHNKTNGIKSIENSKKLFNNINLDLIYSTKLDTKKLLLNDLKTAYSLGINHISCYSLTIEKGTPFYKTPENKKNDENLEIWFIDEIKKLYSQYEISNFGQICKHNFGYWQLNNYIGIGAGAVGFKNNTRFYTHKSPQNYIKNPTFKKIEKITPYQLKEEKILLGFRSKVGVDKNILNKNELIKSFELVGDKLYFENNRFYSKDFLLADALTLWIISSN